MAESVNNLKVLAESLVEQGITTVFAVPGSGSSFTLLSELADSGTSCYVVNHEASASLMAGALCNEGSTRAASISIKGPGLANMSAGVISNYFESRPALSISESYAQNAGPESLHKRFDHELLLRQFVKGHVAPEVEELTAGIATARAERPGPLHLDLGITESVGIRPGDIQHLADIDDCNRLYDAIDNSRRPLVVLGAMARRQGLDRVLNDLSVPFCTTASGKGTLDETSSYFAGVITGETGELSPEKQVISKADIVIGIGLRNYELTRLGNFEVPVICVDSAKGDWIAGLNSDSLITTTSLDEVCGEVCSLLADRSWGEDVIKGRNSLLESMVESSSWNALRVTRILQDQSPVNTSLVLDTGFHCTVGETVWFAGPDRPVLGSSVARYMGTSIPTAVGLSLASKEPVVCLFGDGGVSPFFAEVRLAARHQLNILFVLFSDGSLGSVSSFVDPDSSVAPLLKMQSSWADSFTAMGIPAYLADCVSSLESAIAQWKAINGPAFIECAFDPVQYAALAKRLR